MLLQPRNARPARTRLTSAKPKMPQPPTKAARQNQSAALRERGRQSWDASCAAPAYACHAL